MRGLTNAPEQVDDVDTHAATHYAGGSDPLTPADIGAAVNSFGILTEPDLFEWALKQMSSGGFIVDPSVTTQNVPLSGVYLGGFLTVHGASAGWALEVTFGNTIGEMRIWKAVTVSGVWQPWKQLATTDYALPRDGSARMTGALKFGTEAQNVNMLHMGTVFDIAYNRMSIRFDQNRMDTYENISDAIYLRDTGSGAEHKFLTTGNVTAGTTDLTAGSSALATGAMHLVYE